MIPMCGRYTFFTDEQNQEIMNIIKQVDKKHQYKTGEIFPTNQVPVILNERVDVLKWGFPNFRNKGVIINARSESASEKRMFKNCLENRRCVIPTTGFYEWKDKAKYHFNLPNSHVLYMAGLYNTFAEVNCFVILTTAANQSTEIIHDRMPLVLSKNMINVWLDDSTIAMHLLHDVPPKLIYDTVDNGNIELF